MFQSLARSFVYSNIWVGLAVASLSVVSFLTFRDWNWDYVLLCFTSTIAFYGYARLVESVEVEEAPEQHIAAWTLSHRNSIIGISALCTLASLYFWFDMDSAPRWTFAVASAFSGLYTLPSLFNRRGVRYMAGFKLFYIAAIWTIVTLTIPAMISKVDIDLALILHHFERVFFLIAITIPFDIRDARTDATDMLTLPMWLGTVGARNLALTCIAFVILLQLYPGYNAAGIPWTEVGVYLLTGYLVHRSDEELPDMYFSFVIEGLPILLAIATAIWFGASYISV